MENSPQQSAANAAAATAAAQSGGYPAQPPYQHLLHQQQEHLQMFWNYHRQEIEQATDFKNHQLPLARIKKIMKADEDVRMISAEAPILFAKACELFILELTIRSWLHAEKTNDALSRRTISLPPLHALTFSISLLILFLGMRSRKRVLLVLGLAWWVQPQVVFRTIIHQWDSLLQLGS